jgi:hypothetical protein
MLRMRYVGRCLLLLLLTGMGGLFAHVIVTDYHVTNGGGDVIGAFGGAGPFWFGAHYPISLLMVRLLSTDPSYTFSSTDNFSTK